MKTKTAQERREKLDQICAALPEALPERLKGRFEAIRLGNKLVVKRVEDPIESVSSVP